MTSTPNRLTIALNLSNQAYDGLVILSDQFNSPISEVVTNILEARFEPAMVAAASPAGEPVIPRGFFVVDSGDDVYGIPTGRPILIDALSVSYLKQPVDRTVGTNIHAANTEPGRPIKTPTPLAEVARRIAVARQALTAAANYSLVINHPAVDGPITAQVTDALEQMRAVNPQ